MNMLTRFSNDSAPPQSVAIPAPRLPVLDFIRGVALLGILVMNSQTYSLFALLPPPHVYALGLDRPATYVPTQFLIHLFVKGQFYTIYSFLFGLGFCLMLDQAARRGLDGPRLFRRRLWVLLGLGLVHALVFWFGDVLHKYALLGFTLLYFRRQSVPTLARWILGLTLYVVVFQVAKAVFFPVTPEGLAASQQQFDAVALRVAQTWQTGSVFQVLSLQKLGVLMLHVMGLQSGLAGFVHYEIMFLLGLIAGKWRLFYRLAELTPRLRQVAGGLLVPALALKAFASLAVLPLHLLPPAQLAAEKTLLFLAEFIATPLLTIVYLIGLTLWSAGHSGRLFTWIANTGRLGLTNYLGQTLLCMGVFYGYAGGWAGRVTLLESGLLVGLLYGVQVLYSNWWLRSHAQGPLEQLWRRLTYGRLPPSAGQVATRP